MVASGPQLLLPRAAPCFSLLYLNALARIAAPTQTVSQKNIDNQRHTKKIQPQPPPALAAPGDNLKLSTPGS